MNAFRLAALLCFGAVACTQAFAGQDAPDSARGLSRIDESTPATIEGMLSYPSDVGLPEDLKVCAVSVETTKETCTTKRIRLKRKGHPEGYRLTLPAGDYQVYATTAHTGAETRGYFTEAVPCGLQASCRSHAIVTVKLLAGSAQGDVDPGDWYQDKWPDAVKSSAGSTVQAQPFAPDPHAQASPPAGLVAARPSYALVGEANKSCEAMAPLLTELRGSLSIASIGGTSLKAGETKTISWSVGPQRSRAPTYLIIAADEPLRANGEGFYVLTPDAIAPFGLRQFKEQTRIVIPIHIKDAAGKGDFEIRPLKAGSLHLSASIVGVGSCGELADPKPKSLELVVGAGAPEIVVSNRFEIRKPDQSILSPNGTRRIDIVGPRWRLIDVASGSQLAELVGTEPRFSPTGRFIVAAAEDDMALFDAEDGAQLRKVGYNDADIAWDDRDSFLIVGAPRWASLSVSGTLKEGGTEMILGGGCHACTAVTTDAFRIDLENNIAITSVDQGKDSDRALDAQILTGKAKFSEVGKGTSFQTFVTQYQSVALTMPRKWEFVDGLKFTRIMDYSQDPKFETALRRYLIAPVVVTEKADNSAPVRDPLVVATRGLGRVEIKETVRLSKQEERLQDFGLEINTGTSLAPADKASLLRPTGKADVTRFSQDARIVLDQSFNSANCGGSETQKDGTTLVSAMDLAINQASAPGFTITTFNGSCPGGSMVVLYPSLFIHDSRKPGKIVNLVDTLPTDPFSSSIECSVQLGACNVSGAIFFDRYLLIWSKESFAAALYDLMDGKILHSLIRLPSPDALERMSLSRDLKTLVKLDSDGGFQVLDLDRSQKDDKGAFTQTSVKNPVILSGRVVDDEVVVQTPSGLFDATPEGASYVSLKLPGRSGEYTLAQYRSVLQKPGLLRLALADKTPPAVAIDRFPPEISVKSTSSPQRILADVQIVQESASVLRVYQDGQFTDEIAVPDGKRSVPIDVARLPGSRWVAIVAKGTSGLYSQAATFDAGQVEGSKRRVHIISVGVDRYDDPAINQLELAASDARKFYDAIQAKSGKSLEIVSHALLTDAGASKEAILGELKTAIDSAQPGDTVLLFVAGHGIQTPDNQYFLATTQTRLNDISGTALRWSDLAAVLAKSKSRIAVFLDSCHSGSAGTGFFATSDTTTSALIDNVPSGIVIFSAAKGRELSEESPSSGGGVFTDALVKAMESKATDLNGDGAIEASELYAGVKGAVMRATDGRQTPWFARNDMVGDFVPF